MHSHCYTTQADYGPNPYVTNVSQMALHNSNFRTTVWTGDHMQMTLMYLPVQGEIGLENHADTDQMLRVEQGIGVVMMGADKTHPDFRQSISQGDCIFVPAGSWHNIVNTGRLPLRLSSVYAPPHHPGGTIHRTREEAEHSY